MDCEDPSIDAQVYGDTKILPAILAYCDWPTLMCVSRVSSMGREGVRGVVKDAIYRRFRPFVGGDLDCRAFLDTLHVMGGGILGTVVRDIFGVNSPYEAEKVACLWSDGSNGGPGNMTLTLVVPLH